MIHSRRSLQRIDIRKFKPAPIQRAPVFCAGSILKGDRVRLVLPMPVRAVVANPQVAADRDRVAFQRGPIVFCAEAVDNAGASVRTLPLSAATPWQAEFRAELLGGVEVLRAPLAGGPTVQAIPYFAWANRGPDEMSVWFLTTASP